MEQVRHVQLDTLCESIGKLNEKRNRITRDEDADKQAALDYMSQHGVEVYHHYGTELLLRHGASKLIVRKHKEPTATMSITASEGDEAL